MSARRQSKRAAFAATIKKGRRLNRVFKDNQRKPGFIGVVTSMTLTLQDGTISEKVYGYGALFMLKREGTS